MNTETKYGVWLLSTFKDGKETRLINGRVNHNVIAPNDCWGDVLFDYMTDNGIIDNFYEYETDGDSESVAIMHKVGTLPDFRWEFREYAPEGPDTSDCHTHS
jgi:hypothetical protein